MLFRGLNNFSHEMITEIPLIVKKLFDICDNFKSQDGWKRLINKIGGKAKKNRGQF